MTLVAVLQIIAALSVFGALWLYQRRKRQRASEPKCPVCRSRRLEGIVDDDMGPAILGDEFRCRDCGVAYNELDDELRRLVDVLVDLQQLELPVLRARQEFFKRLLFSDDDSRVLRSHNEQLTNASHDLVDVWEQLDHAREDYPEAFDAELPESDRGKTAGEVLTESLQEDDDGGILETASNFLPGLRSVQESYRAERTLDQIREAIAAEVDRRRAT
jgi:hypothetical protein